MEVVAVSRSTPKELDLGFMKLTTSLIHEPLTSPTDSIELNEKSGVVGNQPAVHDGPVYVFFAEHYDYWCAELGVDRRAWDWCHWAENITVRYKKDTTKSLRRFETEMHLGEVWRVGPDVRLELCGSRIPCQKVSWRCGQKDSWLRPLAESGRVGVYMRVLQGGRVRPGDDVAIESVPAPSPSASDGELQQHEQPSVAMISRIAFDASLKTSDTLDLLANHKLLLPMNRKFLAAKKVAIEDKLNAGKNAWRGWRELRIAKVVQELGDVKSFYLEPVDGAPLANYLPGQFLSVRVPASSVASVRDQVVRSWTISNYDTREGPKSYRLTIKRSDQPSLLSPTPTPTTTTDLTTSTKTNASSWMHTHAAPGTILSARSPAGRFVLDWSQPVAMRPVYISAGIGITPIAAMLGAHGVHPKFARTPALWVHVARSRGDLALWREAGEGAARGDGLSILHEEDDDGKGKVIVHQGRPDRETLKHILGASCRWNVLGAGELDVPAKMSTFYMCGPTAFETTVKECLAEVGIPPANIRSESFTATVRNSGDLETAQVRFAKSGKTATWSRDKPVSLLELAESLGLTPDYGCRVGACGSCAAKVMCGSVSGAGVMQPDGTVLTCSAKPASDVVEVDI
ncbi:oxidoreductase-like protein [Apiospora sp. TS-2023a]